MNAGTEVMDRSPGLGSTEAMHRVLRDDPALLASWHQGEAGSAALPAADATTDPGPLLLASIGAKVAAGMEREAATAATFKAYPALAAAYHRGELVVHLAQPQAAAIVTFAAAMGGTVAGNTITGAEVFRVGEWNGRHYSAQALDDMVAAFDQVGYRPPVTMGHNAADDAPAHGYIAKLYRKGDVLLADLAGVPPETIQAIREGRVLSVSAEVYFGLKRNGRTFPHAIRALSLLGAHPPGVNLRPIAEALPA